MPIMYSTPPAGLYYRIATFAGPHQTPRKSAASLSFFADAKTDIPRVSPGNMIFMRGRKGETPPRCTGKRRLRPQTGMEPRSMADENLDQHLARIETVIAEIGDELTERRAGAGC